LSKKIHTIAIIEKIISIYHKLLNSGYKMPTPTEQLRIPSHDSYHGQGPEFCQHCGVKIEANVVECWNCKAPINDLSKTTSFLPEFLRPKQKVGTLDLFAGIMVLVVWVAASGWIISSYGISWGIVVGIACSGCFLWLCSVWLSEVY
jgi:hypothetical protein